MFEHTITEENSLKCITVKGRIDALSSPDLQRTFSELVLAGDRLLLVDMTDVNYISSVGLRVFISTQKELKKVGGEIIILGMAGPVSDVFKMSGLTGIFRIVLDRAEIQGLLHKDLTAGKVVVREVEGIRLDSMEGEQKKGSFFIIGSQDKTESSSYTEKDVIPVRAAEMPSGCGLAVLGDSYDDYRKFFGESLVINGSFFFFPAVRHSSVDFLINAHQDPAMTYKFLHGFGFSGAYSHILSFQGTDRPLDLNSLIKGFFCVSSADLLGITLIAESRGLWGVHMKKVPLLEQQPVNGKSIFATENFQDWIDFPVEPSYAHHIVVATGIAVRDRTSMGDKIRSLLAEGSNFHLHGAIFEKAPIGKKIFDFDKELLRIFNDFQVHKIQHLLGRSKFSGGMAGIVELEA